MGPSGGQRGRAAPERGCAGRGLLPEPGPLQALRPAQRRAPRPRRPGSGGLGLLLGLQAGLPGSMKSQERAIRGHARQQGGPASRE